MRSGLAAGRHAEAAPETLIRETAGRLARDRTGTSGDGSSDRHRRVDPRPFTDGFLDALGRWQRGWRRDRKARGPIGAALEREAASLLGRFRDPRGAALGAYLLYRLVDDLIDLVEGAHRDAATPQRH